MTKMSSGLFDRVQLEAGPQIMSLGLGAFLESFFFNSQAVCLLMETPAQ